MNAIPDAAGLLPSATYTLRRTGRKALRFEGWQLIEAVGTARDRHVWHDLNVFRTLGGGVVVELIVHNDDPDQPDIGRVETFADLAAAAAWLESYPVAADVPVPGSLGTLDTALPWAMLHAAQLRQRLAGIELDYRALLSEVFAALDLTEPADGAASSGAAHAASDPGGRQATQHSA